MEPCQFASDDHLTHSALEMSKCYYTTSILLRGYQKHIYSGHTTNGTGKRTPVHHPRDPTNDLHLRVAIPNGAEALKGIAIGKHYICAGRKEKKREHIAIQGLSLARELALERNK